MTEKERASNEKAANLTFTFYVLALIFHAVYSYIVNSRLGASFYILIVGLVIFYISDFWYRKKN